MKKTVYEVRKEMFEVSYRALNKRSIKELYWDEVTHDSDIVAEFDTPEEAKSFFQKEGLNVPEKMYPVGVGHKGAYVYYIEESEYEIDEDGDKEWVGGGDWIDSCFPINDNGCDDEEEC